MRSTAPQASSRANKSAVEPACAKASIWLAWLPIDSKKNSGPGCVVTRFTNHASLGITHEMALGLTPVFSNHRPHVHRRFARPQMTKCLGRRSPSSRLRIPPLLPLTRVCPARPARSAHQRTPGAARERASCVDRTDGL